MNNVTRDLRYGFRTLLQTPTFTALTILTLALAIGVNTAIFTMVNVLMFRPLPMKDTDNIGFFYFDHPERGVQNARMSAGDFLDYRERFTSFTELATVNRGRSAWNRRWPFRSCRERGSPVYVVGFGEDRRFRPRRRRGPRPGRDSFHGFHAPAKPR